MFRTPLDNTKPKAKMKLSFLNLFLFSISTAETIRPRSKAAAQLLRSSPANYPYHIYRFKAGLIRCKIQKQILRIDLTTACQHIIEDFRTLFKNDISALENNCRTTSFHSTVPCFSKFH